MIKMWMCRSTYLNDQYELRIHSTPATYFSLIPDQNHAITQLSFQNRRKKTNCHNLHNFHMMPHERDSSAMWNYRKDLVFLSQSCFYKRWYSIAWSGRQRWTLGTETQAERTAGYEIRKWVAKHWKKKCKNKKQAITTTLLSSLVTLVSKLVKAESSQESNTELHSYVCPSSPFSCILQVVILTWEELFWCLDPPLIYRWFCGVILLYCIGTIQSYKALDNLEKLMPDSKNVKIGFFQKRLECESFFWLTLLLTADHTGEGNSCQKKRVQTSSFRGKLEVWGFVCVFIRPMKREHAVLGTESILLMLTSQKKKKLPSASDSYYLWFGWWWQ